MHIHCAKKGEIWWGLSLGTVLGIKKGEEGRTVGGEVRIGDAHTHAYRSDEGESL